MRAEAEQDAAANYVIDRGALAAIRRADGISGMLRVAGDEPFLELAIRSHIDFFDELVAVYNRCSDATLAVLHKLAAEHPAKMRLYEYRPHVWPPHSKEHAATPPDSPHSLVNYNNYALSKTRRRWLFKLDADQLGIALALAHVTRQARRRARATDKCFLLRGIELCGNETGAACLLPKAPFCGGWDHWCMPVTADNFFIHTPRWEAMRMCQQQGVRYSRLVTFWHLKRMKEGERRPPLATLPPLREALRPAWLARLWREREARGCGRREFVQLIAALALQRGVAERAIQAALAARGEASRPN